MIFSELAEHSEWGLLALRIAIGVIFIVHGWPKITGARRMAAMSQLLAGLRFWTAKESLLETRV
jgi:uncharacterized membrane protein YphA (DoxX/SURF4 family)